MSVSVDLTGLRFGRLTVTSRAASAAGGRSQFTCVCDCGAIVVVGGRHLRSSDTRSCGCWRVEASTTHGMRGSPEWRTWISMKTRCLNSHRSEYTRYGGRGITICDRWLHSFESFFADMGERPTPWHSIDRINNDGNYEPDNCRWATVQQQAENRSNVQQLEFGGQVDTLKGWSRRSGIPYSTLRRRLTAGWPLWKALDHREGR